MSTERHTILVSATYMWGILLFVLFAVITLAWFRHSGPGESYDQKRARARVERLKTLEDANREKLEKYGWADKQKGIVNIPIERAIELAMVDLKNKQVQASSVKVENPYPSGLQSAPAAALATTGTSSPAPAAAPATTGTSAPPAAAAAPAPAATPEAVK